jgi:nucleoside-diphosphate-sugar epimerase
VSDSKVLVTGAGGLMGQYVVDELRTHATVKGFDLLESITNIEHIVGDVEDADAVADACSGCDAVVHIAARPNIWSGTGSEIIQTNTVGTWNVLAGAERAGVKRVVITSSDSVLGFTVLQGAMLPPDYLPAGPQHALRATDPYALSKVLAERMAESFVDRGKLEVLAIRPVYVLYPEFECEVLARAQDPDGYVGPAAGGRQPAGGGVMWQYIDPRDLARAFRLALGVEFQGFEAFLICAQRSLAPNPTVTRLKEFLGRDVTVRKPEVYAENPYAPIYDLQHAHDRLGFLAMHDARARLGLDAIYAGSDC